MHTLVGVDTLPCLLRVVVLCKTPVPTLMLFNRVACANAECAMMLQGPVRRHRQVNYTQCNATRGAAVMYIYEGFAPTRRCSRDDPDDNRTMTVDGSRSVSRHTYTQARLVASWLIGYKTRSGNCTLKFKTSKITGDVSECQEPLKIDVSCPVGPRRLCRSAACRRRSICW